MTSSLFGFLFGALVVSLGIFGTASHAAQSFLDLPSVLIVAGGSLAACLMAMRARDAIGGLKVSLRLLKNEKVLSEPILTEIIQFSQQTRGDRNAMKVAISSIRDEFFRDGVQLILDKVPPDRVEMIVGDRIECERTLLMKEVTSLRNLGKYPAAFGMIGTVIGLVGVLQSLGTPDGAKNIGPAMAVGLITTLYGLLFSNLAFGPLADRLLDRVEEKIQLREITLLGVMLILSGDSPIVIQEALNARVPIPKRVDALGLGRSENASAA